MSIEKKDKKPGNKAFWIYAIAGVIVITIITVLGISLGSSTKQPSTSTNPDNQNASISAAPPKIQEVTASVDKTNTIFHVQTSSWDTNKWYVEYELQDEDRVVKKTSYSTENKFDITVPISDSSYYRLKVRLSDKKQQQSAWGDSTTIKLSEVKGLKTLQPDPAYYSTAWATGVGNLQTLKDALGIAYQAESAEGFRNSQCLPLNTGEMRPTLLLPPLPAVAPSGAKLFYIINSFDDTNQTASITYYWCV